MYIDYRRLNEIVIKNRYPLPLITELRDRLIGAVIFTTIDLKGAYNLIRIKEGHEWKTAFRTQLRHFEYLIIPFSLANTPAIFQNIIDEIMRKFDFIVVYLNDILVFSKNEEEHRKYIYIVLQELQNNKLLAEPKKYRFHQKSVIYLGYQISPGEIRMDPAKLEAIRDWKTPTTVKEVRAFHSFTNFYRSLIRKFGEYAAPLTDLTRKDKAFE